MAKPLSLFNLWTYGLFGLPLALLALPIYVYVPQFYAERFGLSLSLIGTALLFSRVLDAFFDPLLGWWIDRRRAALGYGYFVLLSLPMMGIGFVALFHPPAWVTAAPFAWFFMTLIVVYFGFSLATIAHQSWGAALTQAQSERARLTAMREACGLVGVISAAALTQLASVAWLSSALIVSLLVAAWFLLRSAPRPVSVEQVPDQGLRAVWAALLLPFANKRFCWLFAVFVMNGIAAAIPATLFLFFAKDRLQLGDMAGVFLMAYFLAAAVAMPMWAWLSGRYGEVRAWLVGMVLSVVSFVWAYGLGAGDAWPFVMVCVLSGFALGADLSLPPALLASVIQAGGHSGQREGAYFGAWNWANKMNLALAAGISLPLLQLLGYVPNAPSSAEGMQALSLAYAVLPCGLKLIATAILWRAPLRAL
jgi:glycoside/pentoside/hexuronide:cation symporter, GPH family